MKRYYLILFSLLLSLILFSCEADKDIQKLENPTLSVSELGLDNFTVTWNAVNGADEYVYKLDNSVEFTTDKTFAQFKQLTPGQSYMFRIKAVSTDNESEWTEILVELREGQINTPVPVLTGKTETSFTLVWEKVENARKYEYRINEGNVMETDGFTVTVDKDSEGKPLTSGTDYSFSIRAISNDDSLLDSDWFNMTVKTDLPPYSADLDIEFSDITTTGFTVKMTPNENMKVFYSTLSYADDFDKILDQENGKESIIDYIMSNVQNGSVGQYTEETTLTMDILKSETDYVIMAVGFDSFDRYDLYYAKATTLQEEVPDISDELFDKLEGEWTGTQTGYAFEIPYASEDNPDPEPILMNTEAAEAHFEVSIVKNEGEYVSYRDRNQMCIQFKSFNADRLSLGYKSIEDLISMGWSEKDAILGYGPKALIDISEDGTMQIKGLYSDIPSYTWDSRYRNEVTFMNITCDPEDGYMPSGDSLPLKVEISEDGNQITISGSMGPGFRYRRISSAGPIWCAASNMVLTKKAK